MRFKDRILSHHYFVGRKVTENFVDQIECLEIEEKSAKFWLGIHQLKNGFHSNDYLNGEPIVVLKKIEEETYREAA